MLFNKTNYYYEIEDSLTLFTILQTSSLPNNNAQNSNYYFFNQSNLNFLLNSFTFTNIDLKNDSYAKYIPINQLHSDLLFEKSQTNLIINRFLFIKQSTFISFFVNNLIDVPTFFKKSKSLKRIGFELPILKFNNLLMREGKKEQTVKFFAQVAIILYKKIKENNENLKMFNYTWMGTYLVLNNLFFFKNQENSLLTSINSKLNFNNFFFKKGKFNTSMFFIKNFISSIFTTISPIFNFFIYNVDKGIRKNSRGKSGKYIFVWKYIASYKRIHNVMRSIAKDVKFNNERKFRDRILNTLIHLFFNFKKSFLWKYKIFSYNYIFKNFRKTLMSDLKTIK